MATLHDIDKSSASFDTRDDKPDGAAKMFHFRRNSVPFRVEFREDRKSCQRSDHDDVEEAFGEMEAWTVSGREIG